MKNLILFGMVVLLASCQQQQAPGVKNEVQPSAVRADWQSSFQQQLPLLGHRNWILVVDQAFPLQSAGAMEYIYTGRSMAEVLSYVLPELKTMGHVKPMVYRDKEWDYQTETNCPGKSALDRQLAPLLAGEQVNTILHEAVFGKLDQSAKLFKVLVLKTNEKLAYSSVFLELDCAYWDAAKESRLREAMQAGAK